VQELGFVGACRRESFALVDASYVVFGDWENIVTVLSEVSRVNILKTDGSVSSCV
jgi:hypothetical protein